MKEEQKINQKAGQCVLLAVKGIRFVGDGVGGEGGEGCKVEEKKKKKNTQNSKYSNSYSNTQNTQISISQESCFFLLFFLLASRTSRSAWALSCTWSAGHRGCPEGVPRSASA